MRALLTSSLLTPSPAWRGVARCLLVLFVILAAVAMYRGTSYGPADYAPGIPGFAQVLRIAERLDHGPDMGNLALSVTGTESRLVTLPDTMPRSGAGAQYATYRVEFDIAASAAKSRRAVCVPRWSTTATVWLDKQELLSSAPGVQGMRDWTRAQFVSLPPNLPPGTHTLTVQLRGLAWLAPGLSEIWEGDQALIRQACQDLQESRQGWGTGALYIMATFGLAALVVALFRRNVSVTYLVLLAVVWTLHHLTTNGTWTWTEETTWSRLYLLSRPLRDFAVFCFCVRFTGACQRRHERWLWLTFGAGCAALAFLPSAWWMLWLAVMGGFVLLLAMAFMPVLIRYALERSAVSGYLFSFAGVVLIMTGGLDFLRWLGLVSYGSFSFAYLGTYAFGLAMASLMVEKMILFARHEAHAADRLQQEVEWQRVRISADFEVQEAQHRKIALLEERKRIVRDMHDGLGSQLVSASALLRMPDATPALASELITQALTELRSVLDVLSAESDIQHSGDEVSMLLAKLRHRIAPVFQAQAIAFIWETAELPDNFLQEYAQRLQLLRLLQEALTNVLKHSEAGMAHFRISVTPAHVLMEIQDDGKGFADHADSAGPPPMTLGQGLPSMRVRAIQLECSFQLENTFPGTRLRLTFPRKPDAGQETVC